MTSAHPVLVEVTRAGQVESWHRGSFVLLGAGRDVVAGDVTGAVFARSALKPFQAVAMLEAGFDGPVEHLALAAASHRGEPRHLRVARAILAAGGVDEAELGCPPDLPTDPEVLIDYVRGGGAAASICHNCSGKHAAMLVTCRVAGWDRATYLDPAHPLQVAARGAVERFTGEAVAATGVDGCGAPAYAVSLQGLARGYAALLAAPPDSPAGRVAAAMRAHPGLVSGAGSEVSELMSAVDGLLLKDGADGVTSLALPDRRAFAAKFDDGGGRGRGALVAAVLRHWGLDGPVITRWAAVPVLGGGRPAGEIWSTLSAILI